MKRAFDLVLSVLLLIILAPLLLALCLLVYAAIGRPVFFRQQRPGRWGRPFRVWKFRTMSNERGDAGALLPDHDRLGTVGKLLRETSLDELPELINIMRGEMSFVGPRPLLMEYLPLYSKDQARRHDVRPGLTGWAQVNGRNALSWEEKFAMDVWYVDNRTMLLDLKILLLTAMKVLKREGISQQGRATAEKFGGNKS